MNKRVAVVGAGPVGCVLAACLSAGGCEVTLCDVAPELLAPVKEAGLTVTGVRELSSRVAATAASVEDLAAAPPEIIFLAVKATALPLLAHAIRSFYQEGMVVVCWQNGIDTELVLAEELGPAAVVRAVVNYGCSLLAPGRVELVFEHPPHYLQELSAEQKGQAEMVAEMLTSCGLETRRADNLNRMVWRKTILNSCLNPVCAVTGTTMAGAMADLFASRLADELMKEGIRVARANEISLGWDFYRWGMEYLRQAGAHKPSMLNDLQAGRLTEIDFINGKIIEFGVYAGVETPCNRTMVALVKTLEKTRPYQQS